VSHDIAGHTCEAIFLRVLTDFVYGEHAEQPPFEQVNSSEGEEEHIVGNKHYRAAYSRPMRRVGKPEQAIQKL
jgi:hypothetical protein